MSEGSNFFKLKLSCLTLLMFFFICLILKLLTGEKVNRLNRLNKTGNKKIKKIRTLVLCSNIIWAIKCFRTS